MELNRFAKQAKLLKKISFSNATVFLPRKTPVAQKHRAISRQEKIAPPSRVVLESPPPSPESVWEACMLTSQPNFLTLIGY